MRVRKKPVEVDAVRYGREESGEWYDGAVDDLTCSGVIDCERIRPAAGQAWDPPELADLEVYDKLHDTWVKVAPGQWVIRGVQGETYPCADDVLRATYDFV